MIKILQFTVLFFSLSIALAPASLAQESRSKSDPEYSGVAGGGAGGLPSSFVGISSFGESTGDASSRSTTTSSTVQPSFRRTSKSSTSKAAQVLLTRRQMLDCIDTALNANDLSIKVDDQDATVRILSIDLKSATLRGRILETNKPVLLIEKAKQAAGRALPPSE